MPKQLLSLLLIFLATIAIAQKNNCSKIKHLISEANNKQLKVEVKGKKFHTADDLDAWIAATKLDRAAKCYIQDAQVSKMYVAEFGTSAESKTADPALSKKMDELNSMLKNCLGVGFVMKEIKDDENIFRGYQYDGKGENTNTKITVMIVYNTRDKKQMLFVSLINDPG